MQLIVQRQKLINTDKPSLWLYNRKSLRTQRNQVCDYTLDYTTAKAYQHWQTEFVIIQRWLCNWLYNGKSLSTLTSWVCDSSRQPQKSTNTEKSRLWLYTWLYNGKSLSTLTNWVCDYTTVIMQLIVKRQKVINTDKLIIQRKSLRTQTQSSM